MKYLTQQIIDRLITTKSFINDYPKPGVIFLAMNSLFKDAGSRKIVTNAATSAINSDSFDAVAGIASRGYVFSGMIASQFENKGENFIEKVKSRGDSHYVQIDTQTEYSSDALQVLKNSIEKGKKYLLTDDLIATGGSVMSAVKLIKKCGGIVDTVFVMTELLDFEARAKLKQEGVELISLLSFTNQDLQKLLQIQACYSENSSTPITYKLTYHTKGEQALILANDTSKLTVHLASQSPLKNNATESAFKGMFDPLAIEVFGHNSPSGVSDQPLGDTETMKGATNRITSMQEEVTDFDNTVLVSMENGLRYSKEEDTYFDFVQLIVKKGDMTFSHTQDCCKVAPDIINAIAKDKNNHFLETWGDAAKKMGMAKESNNPHQEACFGGISRSDHLFSALCRALGKLKEQMMANNPPELEDQPFNISRLVNINNNRFKKKYAQKGIFFSTPAAPKPEKVIDLYNQGCLLDTWGVDPEKAKQTTFKVFSTGDAFSILSQSAKIKGANINIHVGVEHSSYSPLVLLQEALQLSRCTYEHGAEAITIALPEQYHPALHYNDFNLLLMKLFKASGANKIYYYDKNYRGTLDQTNISDVMPLTLSKVSDAEHYKISRKDLLDHLHFPKDHLSDSLDDQVLHFTRRNRLSRAWDKFDLDKGNILENLGENNAPAEIKIPEIKSQPHVLLCCSANRPLAEKIAASLRERGETVRFYHVNGKGKQATIPNEADICGAVVTIVQSTRPNPDNFDETSEYQVNGASSYFFEAAMIARQARLRGAEKINLINPYQYSARSDKAEDSPHGKTGSYVQLNGQLLQAAGVNHVVTAECHDAHTLSGSYTGKNIRGSAVQGLTIMSTRIASDWVDNLNQSRHGQLRLVTPDAGATKRTKELTLKLQSILGDKLSESRILGEKQRDSHKDDSAVVNSLNTGSVGINPDDKYLITDDETATGSTLCQAITNLKNNGAKDISVAIVHNNMPLDWLQRQLCLARFIYLGVNDLHFSNTQEMGTLATGFDDLICSYSQKSHLSTQDVEAQASEWFMKNIAKDFSNQSKEHLMQAFVQFKSTFDTLESKITVHSLANEFASQVSKRPYMSKSIAETGCNTADTQATGTNGFYSNNKDHFSLFKNQSEKAERHDDLLEHVEESLTASL